MKFMKKNYILCILSVLLISLKSNAELKINPITGTIQEDQKIDQQPVSTLNFDGDKFDNIIVVHASGSLKITNSDDTTVAKLDVLNEVSSEECETNYKIENKTLVVSTEKKIFVIKNNCTQDLNLHLPIDKKINISLGTGKVITKGIFPQLDVDLGSGEVNIQGKVSKLNLDVASGSVTVSGLDGYGKITLLSGDLDIKYNKKIEGKFNQLHVSKSVGNTRIQIPKGAKTESKLKTLFGQIYNRTTKSNTGKFYFSVSTNVGDITMDTY